MSGFRTLGSFLRDGRHVARSFGERFFAPGLRKPAPQPPGAVQEAVDRIHPARVEVRVAEIREETASTKCFRLVPPAGAFPPFRAGQYVNVFATVDGVCTSRPYSISSAPGQGEGVEITVRRKPGGFVSPHLLDRVAVGDALVVSAPTGDFYPSPLRDTAELVLVAGGSGIAPFMGILEELAAREYTADVLLLYGSRRPDDIVFRERLDRLAARWGHLRVVHVISEPTPADGWSGDRGFIDRACLLRHVAAAELPQKTFFVCGPVPMYRLVVGALGDLGVPRHRVRVEPFGPPEPVDREPGWKAGLDPTARFRVTLEGRGVVLEALAGEPLMAALERHGVVLPAICRSGACATCRTRLLEGAVFTPAGTALRESDHVAGFIHPCMAFPQSDLTVRLP